MAGRHGRGRRPALRGRRCRGGGPPAGRGAGRAGRGPGRGARPGPRRAHRRFRPAARAQRERPARGRPGCGGDPGDRTRREADPRRDPRTGAGRASAVGPAATFHPGCGCRPAGPGPGRGAGRGAAAACRGHPAPGDGRPRYRPAAGREAAGRAARGHRGARPGCPGPAAGAGGRGHLPGATRPGGGVPVHRPAAPAGRVRVEPDRGAVPAHRLARLRAARRAGRARTPPRAVPAGDGPVRDGADAGVRGGVPAGAERAAGRGVRGDHPAGHRHRAAQIPGPRPGGRRTAAGALRPVARPQPRLPALGPGHRVPAHARPALERSPATARDAAPVRRGAGCRRGRAGGLRAGGRRALGPGGPGRGALQSARRARGGSGDRPRFRGARGGAAVPARRGAARPLRGGAGRVDRRRGAGRGAAARRGAGLAGRAHRGTADGRCHPGRRGGRRTDPAPAVGVLRPGRAAAPGRAEAAAAHPYAHPLAAARLELRPVRGGPGRRRRTRRRPGHGRGGGRRPRTGPGGRMPASPGGEPGAAAPADALSRRPRRRPVRGAAGAGRGCDSDHHTGRAGRSGRVRPQDRGGRPCTRRGGRGRGAAPGRTAGVAGAVALARRPAAGGAQRRQRRPAGPRRKPDPAPARRSRTAFAAGASDGPSGTWTGGRPQSRPPRFRTPGPRPAGEGPAPDRDRPGRRGQPLRAPRTGYARAPAEPGRDRTAHRHRRLDRRRRERRADAGFPLPSGAAPTRAYRTPSFCLPTTRQHDRMRLRQSGTSPHSTGVHQPCSVAEGGWRRPEAPVPTHPRR